MKIIYFGLLWVWISIPALAQSSFCQGDVIKQSITLNSDLDCSQYRGRDVDPTTGRVNRPALRVQGQGLVIDGNGYRIIAPQFAEAISVAGRDIVVKNFIIQDMPDSTAIAAANAPGLIVQDNLISKTRIGIGLYAHTVDMPGVLIRGNYMRDIEEIGLTVRHFDGHDVPSPQIEQNRFHRVRAMAIEASSSSLFLSGSQGNDFDGSGTAITFRGGNLIIDSLDLSRSRLQDQALVVAAAENVQVINSDFSRDPRTVTARPNANTWIGMTSGGTRKLLVIGTKISGQEIAIVSEQYGLFPNNVTLQSNDLKGNRSMGALFRTRGRVGEEKSFGALVITNNDLRGYAPGSALSGLDVVQYDRARSDFTGNQLQRLASPSSASGF